MTQQIRDQLQATLGAAYTLERELGGGGMSRVFVAEETALRRKVAVKVLPPELTAGVNVERFNREILVAAQLQHPHIVPVLTAGETNGLPYYTMPFVEGESLRARLGRTGALSITDAVSILKDVARALAYAHERGIVHRDIKPDNVLITGGSATVTDFGIAKAISASRTQATGEGLTQVGTSIGTPAYMSPEQAAGDPDTDHRTDIYAFGCMAYELLTGQPPFSQTTPRKLLAAHMGEQARSVSELRPGIPATLVELVTRCLAKEAADRPQQASDLVRVLETVTSSGSAAALPAILLGGPGMFGKALALYAAAFAVVALLAKAAIVGIGLPDWVFPGALVVMALGLPMILWTGYVHQVARRAATMTPTYTPGGSPSLARGTIATIALRAAPHVSWYRTARGGLYALGGFITLIAVFMSMRAFGVGPFGSLLASGKLTEREPLLLTDFRTTNADSSLGRVVSDAVRAGLGESGVLTVMSAEKVGAALQRMQQPASARVDLPLARSLAQREGVPAIVDGDITGVGGSYIVQLRLVTADSGVVLASFRETGDGPRGLIDAADKLARAVRTKAGESLRSVHATPPLAQVTTSSLDALRKYTEAYRAVGAGTYADAVGFAREAITLDTGFALAYRQLSEALVNSVGPGPASDSAITQAYTRRDKLAERERLSVIGDYFLNGPGRDRAKAIEAFLRQAELGDFSNTNSVGMALETRRDYALADSLARIRMQLEPDRFITFSNDASWRISAGDLAGADSIVRLMETRWPTRLAASNSRAQLALVRDSIGRARAIVDSLLAVGGWVGQERAVLEFTAMFIAAVQGRDADVGRFAPGQAMGDAGAMNSIRSALGALGYFTVVAVGDGPSRDLTGRVDAIVASPSFAQFADGAVPPIPVVPFQVTQPLLTAARAYAALGDSSKASAMLARYDADVRDTAVRRLTRPERQTTLGFVALAAQRPLDAIRAFVDGDRAPDGPATACAACLELELGMAYGGLHERDSTIVHLERFVRHAMLGGTYPEPLGRLVAPMEERLGQLYEDAGDAGKAAEHYRRFMDLWKHADAVQQPRVAAARARLEKLTPVEKRP